MRNFLIAASLALVTTSGFAAKLSCEAATAELSFLKSSLNKGEVESVISVSREGRSTILRYDGGIDFIGMECRKTKSGRAMLVF